MNEPLKFIHASDLHLDRPFSGVAEAPPHIRKALIDAAYTELAVRALHAVYGLDQL